MTDPHSLGVGATKAIIDGYGGDGGAMHSLTL